MTKKRFLTYWGGALLSYGVPLATVGLVYGLYNPDRTFLNYFTMAGLMSTIVVVACFGKDFVSWVRTLGNDNGNIALTYAKAPAIIGGLAGVLLYAYYSIESLMIVLGVSAVSNLIAIPLKVAHYKLLPEETIARMKAKKE